MSRQLAAEGRLNDESIAPAGYLDLTGVDLPLVQVSMAKGGTAEQKRCLLVAITEAVHESIGAPVPSIRVWIHEFDPGDFIAGGEIMADRVPRSGDRR